MRKLLLALALGSLVACEQEDLAPESERQEVQQEMNKRSVEVNYHLDGSFIYYESFNVFEGNYVNIESHNVSYVFRTDGKVFIDGELHSYTFSGTHLTITNNENSYIFEWLMEDYCFMLSEGNKRMLISRAL